MYDERSIVNLTLHSPSREMRREGVFELPTNQRFRLKQLLEDVPEDPPPPEEIAGKAQSIAELAEFSGADEAVVSAPSYMISAIEQELLKRGIQPLYVHGTPQRYQVDTEVEGVSTVRCGYYLNGFVRPPTQEELDQ